MPLSKESQDICVLNTPVGLVGMLRLTFGVAASPALFQREMDRILRGVFVCVCWGFSGAPAAKAIKRPHCLR